MAIVPKGATILEPTTWARVTALCSMAMGNPILTASWIIFPSQNQDASLLIREILSSFIKAK